MLRLSNRGRIAIFSAGIHLAERNTLKEAWSGLSGGQSESTMHCFLLLLSRGRRTGRSVIKTGDFHTKDHASASFSQSP